MIRLQITTPQVAEDGEDVALHSFFSSEKDVKLIRTNKASLDCYNLQNTNSRPMGRQGLWVIRVIHHPPFRTGARIRSPNYVHSSRKRWSKMA